MDKMDEESIDNGIEVDVVQVEDGEVEDVEFVVEEVEIELVEPTVGMKFTTEEEMYNFIKDYAKKKGFPVKKRTSKKDIDGILRWITYACTREGTKVTKTSNCLKPQPSFKNNCKVKINTSLDADDKWQINMVSLEHNHDCSPKKSRFFRCHRKISSEAKRRIILLDKAGIKLKKTYTTFVVEADGHENVPFLEKDCRNCVEKERRLRLGEGDALAVQSYFLKMQAQNAGFFFNIDLDNEGRLKNVFWADGRSREAYKEFGEVITFDTTYLTNKYAMPFAPFVGVNHHGESILLGCGLVSNEDTDTFAWLFRTWLTCMSESAPKAIITDQDRAMQNAIEIVFPNARHRWCLWHVMKKLPEKLGAYTEYNSITFVLCSVVYDSQSPEEFEKNWTEMVDKYELHANDWLSGLYNERSRWVPCFVKTLFWAGMSTTQRSESMNAFFDGYVDSKTTLKQFVEQYDNALSSKVDKENRSDFDSFSKNIDCITSFQFEKQAQSVYTLSKFKEFQEELRRLFYCVVINVREDGDVTEYDIRDDVVIGDHTKRITFTVAFRKQDCEVKCSCCNFEFRGLLCRHVIVVFIRHDVKIIPDKFILRRWRKDVSRAHTKVKVNYNGWCNTPEQKQHDRLCFAFSNKVADMASVDERLYNHAMGLVDKMTLEMNALKLSYATPHSKDKYSSHNIIDGPTNARNNIIDPVVTNKKGRPESKRKTSQIIKRRSKKNKKPDGSNGNGQDGVKRNKPNKRDKPNENLQGGQTSNPSQEVSMSLGLISLQENISKYLTPLEEGGTSLGLIPIQDESISLSVAPTDDNIYTPFHNSQVPTISTVSHYPTWNDAYDLNDMPWDASYDLNDIPT